MKHRVAIVGGGMTGTACFVALAGRARALISEVRVYDPHGIAAGPGFNTASTSLLANTSIGVTSMVAGDSDHLLRWLRGQPDLCRVHDVDPNALTRSSFVPRGLIRCYAIALFHEACETLDNFGVDQSLIHQKVTDLEPDDGAALLHLDDGSIETADTVILCTGTGRNRRFDHLLGNRHFVPSIYPEPELITKASAASNILIIGSKQSAIDAAILTSETTPLCNIVMLAPSGALPSVRSELIEYPPAVFSSGSVRASAIDAAGLLETVERLATEEITRCYSDHGLHLDRERFLRSPDRRAHQQLRQDFFESRLYENKWQYAIGSLITQANLLWSDLNSDERRAFHQRFKTFISRYVSSIPERNAEKIIGLLDAGRLNVLRLEERLAIEPVEGGLAARFNDGVRRFDLVINATGVETGVRAGGALLDRLVNRLGGSLINEFGGLEVEPETMRLIPEKTNWPRLYGAGPLINGSLLVTNYVNASVRQADMIATDFISGHASSTDEWPVLPESTLLGAASTKPISQL
ncbi:MAG: FAD/NAD(P)-binding protein [Geminicoccaceae bacterium]